jgi:hypothetical protein
VALCLEVPDHAFREHEVLEAGGGPAYRYAVVPAGVLNRIGRAEVYDHPYAGYSRRDLVLGARTWEGGDREARQIARAMREAIAFFDRVGWRAPLRVREENDRRHPPAPRPPALPGAGRPLPAVTRYRRARQPPCPAVPE